MHKFTIFCFQNQDVFQPLYLLHTYYSNISFHHFTFTQNALKNAIDNENLYRCLKTKKAPEISSAKSVTQAI